MFRNLLCIYHANCADGFTAAWVVRAFCAQNRIEVEFHPGVYQNPPPDVTGRDVLLVDFSYKEPVLRDMAARARSIAIIDHHKTAADDLAFAGPLPSWREWIEGESIARRYTGGLPVAALFDTSRCGAGLTWDYFFRGKKRPVLVDYVEDRDLWRFALSDSRAVNAAIFSHKYTFSQWDALATALDTNLDGVAQEGRAIERKHHKDIEELVNVVTRPMLIGGQRVLMANLPYTYTSDAGHLLAEGEPFAGCYWDTPEGRVFSLRSREGGADVSAIAAQYGGGGHKHAAGFRVPFDQLGQFEVTS